MLTILSYFVVISSGRLRFYKTFLARDERSALKGRQIPTQRCQQGEQGGRNGRVWLIRNFQSFWLGLVWATRKKCKVGVGKAVCIIDSCCGIIRFKTTPFCRGFVSCLNDRSLPLSFTLSISISLCLCPRLTPEMLLLSLGCQPHFVRLCSALGFCARLLSRCLVVLATHTP